MSKKIAVIFLFLSFSLTGCHKAPDEKVALDAYGRTTKIVSIILKSPTNAVFPPYSASFIKTRPGEVYEISSYVDVPNASGVNVRTTYTCTLKYTPNDRESIWKLLGFNMDPKPQP